MYKDKNCETLTDKNGKSLDPGGQSTSTSGIFYQRPHQAR